MMKAPTFSSSVGKDNRRRYFDTKLRVQVVQVRQGDFYIACTPGEMLSTILGSCISACVRDPVAGCGGMNHFLLPESSGGSSALDDEEGFVALRYGSFAMEQLINGILARGGKRERLEIKLFGGANVVKGLSGVGHRNAEFVEEYLGNEGFRIAGQHMRGHNARKIQYFPDSGRVRMREIVETQAKEVFEEETARKVITRASDKGGVELFD